MMGSSEKVGFGAVDTNTGGEFDGTPLAEDAGESGTTP